MKVLIVHYHLRPGGVTSVIRRQLSALARAGIDASVLSGEASAGFGGSLSVEPALSYDPPGAGKLADPERVAAIVSAISHGADALGRGTIIHVHNPTIKKNASLLEALKVLADQGRPIVAQVHDLAEDWRPDVYTGQDYPDGLFWATINRFDSGALRAAGAAELFFLPNPVPCPETPRDLRRSRSPDGAPDGAPFILCPIRGIRRKNLGETLLLSLFMSPGGRIGLTLPPTNPRDVGPYERWKETAGRLGAPVSFGLGLEAGLDELYARASAVLTTSVKEGFGLSYLEPLARGIPVMGRRIPRIVSDFEAEGLSFPAMYERLVVPAAFFDGDAFRSRLASVAEAALRDFGRPDGALAARMADAVLEGGETLIAGTSLPGTPPAGPPPAVDPPTGTLSAGDPPTGTLPTGPDFGRLDEQAQAEALSSIAASKRNREAFLGLNPFVEAWDRARPELPGPEALAPWSEAVYQERLIALYQRARKASGGAAPDTRKLLDIYLSPGSLYGVGV